VISKRQTSMRHIADSQVVSQCGVVAALPSKVSSQEAPALSLESPFRLSAALKFGFVFWFSMLPARLHNVI